ncbi:MAG: CDP-alcohol phosphatidyltransferase family protein [Deltaproteobacteria bacterium]|uniref:CDP-alcohol phosphatidyltransferase family protein n=1 Tax=Candidatus Zymogenus saltonus TaxID=2844893 RepID=A0A9D8KCS9_9DELT|nr:CDP-alcohol phosphatidyltransferase family protein [Candidatus Zymogenus saltonus]
MPRYSLDDVREVVLLDSWWGRYFLDPISIRLTWLIANFTRLSPNAVTFFSFLFALVSAYLFYRGERLFLVAGAVVYEFGFILDTVDGKLARLTGKSSTAGAFLDVYLDNISVFLNLFALVMGRFLISGEKKYIIVGLIYIFVHFLQILSKYQALHFLGRGYKQEFYGGERADVGKNLFASIKGFFARRKLSMVLFSTVEGEAIVFFIGPLTGLVFESILVSLVLVFLFFILKSILFFKSSMALDRKERPADK